MPRQHQITARFQAFVAGLQKERWDDSKHDVLDWFERFFDHVLDGITPQAEDVPRLAKLAGIAFDKAFVFPQPIEAIDGPVARFFSGLILHALVKRKAKRAQPKPEPKPSEAT